MRYRSRSVKTLIVYKMLVKRYLRQIGQDHFLRYKEVRLI